MKWEILCLLVTGAFLAEINAEKNTTTSEKCNGSTQACTMGQKRNCAEWYKSGCRISEVYEVYPDGKPLKVYCDMETDGGGWTVFQRRVDGSENFYRTWNEYKKGFGNILKEFWLGNDNLNMLTNGPQINTRYELRVDLQTFDNLPAFVKHDDFSIGPEVNDYTLHIGSYSGTAGDSLTKHNNRTFSTKDHGSVCAGIYNGAWWFANCHAAHLNGRYSFTPQVEYAQGIIWSAWKAYYVSLKSSEMKFRPTTF